MTKPDIETPEDFIRWQQKAADELTDKRPIVYTPTNEDLLIVLKNWQGMVCIELLTDGPEVTVKVDEGDLKAEIERALPLGGNCAFEISCVSHGSNILVLRVF